jgi:hypothetical protein
MPKKRQYVHRKDELIPWVSDSYLGDDAREVKRRARKAPIF